MLSNLEGKDTEDVVADGMSKLASVPAGGGVCFPLAFDIFGLLAFCYFSVTETLLTVSCIVVFFVLRIVATQALQLLQLLQLVVAALVEGKSLVVVRRRKKKKKKKRCVRR